MNFGKPDLERDFIEMWRRLAKAPEPEPEHRFHSVRKWRFDFAWIDSKVAVELEGGIATGGRHTRPGGYQGDCEKYNAAVSLGWRILRYTAKDLRARPIQVIEEIKALIQN